MTNFEMFCCQCNTANRVQFIFGSYKFKKISEQIVEQHFEKLSDRECIYAPHSQ
jgi:hypothetical protein